jgi:hypothetical protein
VKNLESQKDVCKVTQNKNKLEGYDRILKFSRYSLVFWAMPLKSGIVALAFMTSMTTMFIPQLSNELHHNYVLVTKYNLLQLSHIQNELDQILTEQSSCKLASPPLIRQNSTTIMQ